MYSCGPFHMAEQKQGDQLKPTYSSPVPIRDVALKTCLKQWTIGRGGERGSGISVLISHDDDDDTFSKNVLSENKRNNVTGVGNPLLRCHSPTRSPLRHGDFLLCVVTQPLKRRIRHRVNF